MSKSKSRPKWHHYVPELLLKEFTDNNEKLHFCILRSSDGVVINPRERVINSTSPKNLFVETQLYTQYDDHEEKDTSIENSLSSLETKATLVIKKNN